MIGLSCFVLSFENSKVIAGFDHSATLIFLSVIRGSTNGRMRCWRVRQSTAIRANIMDEKEKKRRHSRKFLK